MANYAFILQKCTKIKPGRLPWAGFLVWGTLVDFNGISFGFKIGEHFQVFQVWIFFIPGAKLYCIGALVGRQLWE